MLKKLIPGFWLIIFVLVQYIEGYVELVEIENLPKKISESKIALDQGIHRITQKKPMIADDKSDHSVKTYLDVKRTELQYEVDTDGIKKGIKYEQNPKRNKRQTDDMDNINNIDGEENVMESTEFVAPIMANTSSTVDEMVPSGNNSYNPPSGIPWTTEPSSQYPQQSSANSYYPQQSTCVCQPVYYKPPAIPPAYYHPHEITSDPYFGYSYGSTGHGLHLPILKPFPFHFEQNLHPASNYFKPSHPDSYQESYESPRHNFIPIHKNFFKRK